MNFTVVTGHCFSEVLPVYPGFLRLRALIFQKSSIFIAIHQKI